MSMPFQHNFKTSGIAMWTRNRGYLTLQSQITFQRLAFFLWQYFFLWALVTDSLFHISSQTKWEEEEEMKNWSTEITPICTDFHKARFLFILKARVSNNRRLSFHRLFLPWQKKVLSEPVSSRLIVNFVSSFDADFPHNHCFCLTDIWRHISIGIV